MARHLLQNYSLQWTIAILRPTQFFYRIDPGFLHNQVGCFTEPTWFLFRTDSIALQNRLDSQNRIRTNSVFQRTDLVFFTELIMTQLFYRTDSVFSLNRLGFLSQCFFSSLNKVRAHMQPPIVSCKRTCSSTHARLRNYTKIVVHHTDISDILLLPLPLPLLLLIPASVHIYT